MPNYLNDLNAAIASAETETDTLPPAITTFFERYYPTATKEQYDADVQERLTGQGQFCNLVCGASYVWCIKQNGNSQAGHAMCQGMYSTCLGNCQ